MVKNWHTKTLSKYMRANKGGEFMKINHNPVKITPINTLNVNKVHHQNSNARVSEFQQLLQNQIASDKNIKFSKHAAMRLDARNIAFTKEQFEKLEKGIKKAEEKGIKDSLVLMDQIALVVNIKNRVVITAIDSSQAKDTVFTNIDGAVII